MQEAAEHTSSAALHLFAMIPALKCETLRLRSEQALHPTDEDLFVGLLALGRPFSGSEPAFRMEVPCRRFE